ncbi:putative gustatory receptor 28b [Haliotis cracherodii]|uniref:putative gustatory receptor 28b n=1 Tax=Haliotis cracherodii TaxID=6455 RepID=UPI0039EBA786
MKLTKVEDIGQFELNSFMKPLIQILHLNGFYHGQEQSRRFKCAVVFQAVIFKSLTVYNVVRYCSIFLGENKFDGNLMSSLAVLSFYSYVTYLSLALTFAIPKHFWRYENLIDAYISDFGASPYLMNLKHKIRKFVVIVELFYLSFIISTTLGLNNAFPTLERHMTPFNNHLGSARIALLVFYVFVQIVVSSQLVMAIVLFNTTTICLIKEFRILSKKLEEDMDKFESIFGQFCQRHKRLSLISDEGNSFNSHVAFATYVFGIPMICFLVYGLIRGSLPKDELLFCSGNLCTITALMILVTVMGFVLNDSANEPLQHIFRSNWASYSEETTQKISLFVARLASEKVGYSVYGLFTIDRSTILMVVGTILTYAVVVLQVQPDSGAACNRCLTADNLNLTQLCS